MHLMTPIRIMPQAIVLAVAIAIQGTFSLAQIPIGLGGAPTSTQHKFQADSDAWIVADWSDPFAPAPIQVIPGIRSGPWNQELTFDAAFPALETGSSWVLKELLRVGEGEFEVQAWSLEILTAGWRWGDFNLFDATTSEPVPWGLGMRFTGTHVTYYFESIAPGNEVLLVTPLRYWGPDGAKPSPILIQVTPGIPEPGTRALWAVGLAALFAHATHRRSRLPKHLTSANGAPPYQPGALAPGPRTQRSSGLKARSITTLSQEPRILLLRRFSH